jgi:hypothetical protein
MTSRSFEMAGNVSLALKVDTVDKASYADERQLFSLVGLLKIKAILFQHGQRRK